jgi:mannose-6-phosphate isomerase
VDRLTGVTKHHDWGSSSLIPEFLGQDEDGLPWAEQWFGAHPLGTGLLDSGTNLRSAIDNDPTVFLGPSTQYMFGNQLPYLVKLIAPARALSLQVHPGRNLAVQGFEEDEAAGIPIGSTERVFQDTTHKPEMIYALTDFVALVGFCVRRQARTRLEGLDCHLASRLSRRLRLATGRGIKPVVSWILDPEDGPTPYEVRDFATACSDRLQSGVSPEPEVDSIVVGLQKDFPGEPGIVMCFLMNYLHLLPGTAAFVPTGTVHSYQRGLGLEVMANSDNVIRAGLTSKHIDPQRFLDSANFDGIPPTRIAPEHPVPGLDLFRSPVEDFELTVATPAAPGVLSPLHIPGTGPRILVGLSETTQVQTLKGEARVQRGQALFIPDSDGPIILSGLGTVAQVSVP